MSLSVSHLSKRYGGLIAVNQVSFEATPGEITAVIGPNGAGKTTLLNLISGNVIADEGSVALFGSDVSRVAPHKLVTRGLVRTYQHPQLFDDMTVLETVMVGAHQKGRFGLVLSMLGTSSVRREEHEIELIARKALDQVGIPVSLFERPVVELSYGHQRKVEIARAVASAPRAIMLDEPAAGLNSEESSELAQMIRKLASGGLILILIEHNMKLVMSIADKIVVMNFGKKIAEGTPTEIQNNPDVLQSYLGDHSSWT